MRLLLAMILLNCRPRQFSLSTKMRGGGSSLFVVVLPFDIKTDLLDKTKLSV
jgi:hypothetical protein